MINKSALLKSAFKESKKHAYIIIEKEASIKKVKQCRLRYEIEPESKSTKGIAHYIFKVPAGYNLIEAYIHDYDVVMNSSLPIRYETSGTFNIDFTLSFTEGD